MIYELHYQVDQIKTYSKIEAIKLAQGDWSRVHFNYMESTFAGASWTRPKRTWAQLLRDRCQQIRDTYDHVCLWFSGGWDSTTALNAFAENGIPVDEIAIYKREYIVDVEVDAAVQYATEIKNRFMPNVKITVVPITHRHNELVYEKYGEDWIFTPGSNLMFPKTHRYFIQHELDETKNYRPNDQRRVDLYAHDKPRVLLHDRKWYCFAPDSSMTGYMNTDVELFFISPNMPELHYSQTHMAIDYFESLMRQRNGYCERTSHDYQNMSGPLGLTTVESDDTRYQLWNMACGRTCIDNESARFGWLKVTVGQHPLSQESVRLFEHAKNSNTKAYKIYQQGLANVEQITGLKRPTQADSLWMPTVLSDKYFVRPADTDL